MANLTNYGTVVAQNFWGRMLFNKEENGTLTLKNSSGGANKLIDIQTADKVRIGNVSGGANSFVTVDHSSVTARYVAAVIGTFTNLQTAGFESNTLSDGTATISGGTISGALNLKSNIGTVLGLHASTLTDGTSTLHAGSLTGLENVHAKLGTVLSLHLSLIHI